MVVVARERHYILWFVDDPGAQVVGRARASLLWWYVSKQAGASVLSAESGPILLSLGARSGIFCRAKLDRVVKNVVKLSMPSKNVVNP